MNKIITCGDIDSDSYRRFSEELAEFEDDPNMPVHLELNSGGGSAMDAIAFAERMRLSECSIHVRVVGLAGSAAVLILAAGDHREITQNSWVFVHEESDEIAGTISQLENQAASYRRHENQWSNLMESMTTANKETWDKLHKAETYLNPNECLELGLIDKIV